MEYSAGLGRDYERVATKTENCEKCWTPLWRIALLHCGFNLQIHSPFSPLSLLCCVSMLCPPGIGKGTIIVSSVKSIISSIWMCVRTKRLSACLALLATKRNAVPFCFGDYDLRRGFFLSPFSSIIIIFFSFILICWTFFFVVSFFNY